MKIKKVKRLLKELGLEEQKLKHVPESARDRARQRMAADRWLRTQLVHEVERAFQIGKEVYLGASDNHLIVPSKALACTLAGIPTYTKKEYPAVTSYYIDLEALAVMEIDE